MKAIKQAAFVLLICMAFIQCKKTAGPKGDTGPQGPAGASMEVTTYTTTSSSWVSYAWPYSYLEATLNVPSVTSSVVSGGDVKVFIYNTADSTWIALPQPFLNSQYNYKYKTGKVFIDFTLVNNATPPTPSAQEFKVVVMPPAFIKKNPNVNVNNYEELTGLKPE
ncbi:MAG: hypothetical protein ACXVPQ_00925 [Bacteroidia bacterium]